VGLVVVDAEGVVEGTAESSAKTMLAGLRGSRNPGKRTNASVPHLSSPRSSFRTTRIPRGVAEQSTADNVEEALESGVCQYTLDDYHATSDLDVHSKNAGCGDVGVLLAERDPASCGRVSVEGLIKVSRESYVTVSKLHRTVDSCIELTSATPIGSCFPLRPSDDLYPCPARADR
jgi:hypothetical protein